MINKLWTDVSLENYNNWYPLTGKITETPPQYINTWPNVKDWFITFAIRAQNDINAYLDFILSKFPFDSFKDELIKETLRDMVYVMVEHWVFNRTPIEFNVDATIQFNNGNQFSASSIPTINVWDLAPSRMKIWARLTELKQVFLSYNQDEIDIEKIDLQAFYTRNQVDELIKEQKEFTLSKQMKLYDDLVDDNENEIYRGRVTNFINKGYVATDYDPKTETMILDWPDEIGTLPPESLQNNPQIGDFTHAPTCDFSAKQQKRITTNENEITKLNTELIKANENINDVKNNWFNIETSPLWKKVENSNIEIFKWYFIKISYQYSTENNFMKFYKIIKIYLNNVFNEFELLNVDSMTYSEQIQNKIILNTGTIYYNNKKKEFSGGGNSYPERGKINLIGDIEEIYQYQGIDTPTEFIAEDSTERDYYTKVETNDLLDKKQDKIDNNLITNDKTITGSINEICNEIVKYAQSVDEKLDNLQNNKQDKLTAGTNITIKDNVISAIGGSENWKKVGTISDDKQKITYQFKQNTFYRVGYSAGTDLKTSYGSVKYITFKYISSSSDDILLDSLIDKFGTDITSWIDLVINRNGYITLDKHNWNVGFLYSLEEGKTEETYEIRSNTLEIKKSNNIDITKPLNIKSETLNIKEIAENTFDIELKSNPTPCPYPKWKDVAIANETGYQINYELKNNTYYKIFYDNSIMISKPSKYPCLIKEFYWINSDEISPSDLLVNIPCIGISGKFESGLLIINKKRIYLQNQKQLNIWKLQELQE